MKAKSSIPHSHSHSVSHSPSNPIQPSPTLSNLFPSPTLSNLLPSLVLSLFFFILSSASIAQNGSVVGTVIDKNTQKSVVAAAVALEGTTLGAVTDFNGNFEVRGITPGTYNIKITSLGYYSQDLFNVVVTNGNTNTFTIELVPSSTETSVIEIKKYSYGKVAETPLSVQSLTAEEIRSNPGGNFDISRVIQALPGVGGISGAGERNDLIIRGGAPSENVYYLDGIEVPQINHFTTQGSSGGPQGIINVSFIETATLNSSSFNAKYDNALSSVLQFKQRNGNNQHLKGNGRISSTEVAGTLEGPLGKNTTFLASVRRSYLQYFFALIDLPIRPNYWDFQYKINSKLNEKNTLTTIGIGAIDEFTFAVPKNSDPTKEYIIRSNPNINQWTYTVGVTLKHTLNNGFYNLSASRNMFNNRLDKFEDAQDGDESKRTLKSNSQEIENKLRLEVNQFFGSWKLIYGLSAQYVKYNQDFFVRLAPSYVDGQGNTIPAINYSYYNAIDFFKYGAFASVNKKSMNERLSLTFGIRSDMNSYTTTGNNPLKTIAPRVSASYSLSPEWNLNASLGHYTKLPVYTVLGYKQNGQSVNKSVDYITCNHAVLGLEYLPNNSLRMTAEGFYKFYDNYPVSLDKGISLGNEGAAYGAIGNERVSSTGQGRAYGFELFLQQKFTKSYFLTASYTFFKSEFTNLDGKYSPSAWDNRHLLSLIFGKKFKRGYELGVKYRLAGGAPYTPYDMDLSRLYYYTTGVGTFDYSAINSQRLPLFNQLDIRIDKKINFKKSSLDFFIDIQNVANAKTYSQDLYTFQRNNSNTGYQTTDGQPLRADGSNAIPVFIPNINGSLIPAIGIIYDF